MYQVPLLSIRDQIAPVIKLPLKSACADTTSMAWRMHVETFPDTITHADVESAEDVADVTLFVRRVHVLTLSPRSFVLAFPQERTPVDIA